MGQDVNINGCRLIARSSGALWWPEKRLLCVSDLHFGKADRVARRSSSLLPPYETRETLERLGKEIEALNPSRVICLGDSFDDASCLQSISDTDLDRMMALAYARDWIWIEGNHDRSIQPPVGRVLHEFTLGGLLFRHEALQEALPGEISGHFHPKVRMKVKGTALVRRCFLEDGTRIMLPAFGAYTGGMWCTDPAIDRLFSNGVCAIITGSPCLRLPLRVGALV
ncbi:MAG: ligase-associated DNA damage response endonuclease PdeM [Pseudomonadota bacterium]